ncbi:ubiquitin carboxyl-terminal hydrolase-related protein, partial [Striga asiatica]
IYSKAGGRAFSIIIKKINLGDKKIEKETADPERAAYGANTPLNPSKGRNEQSAASWALSKEKIPNALNAVRARDMCVKAQKGRPSIQQGDQRSLYKAYQTASTVGGDPSPSKVKYYLEYIAIPGKSASHPQHQHI